MNFEDEHYVRVYTRDTKTWLRLGFEGQTVLMHVLRRLDKAGVLDDIEDPILDVALVTRMPEDFVRVGLPRLLDAGVIEHRGNCLVMPRYLEGQTAKKSDAARSRDVRQKRRAQALSASRNVTPASRESENPTQRDESREIVTRHDSEQPVSPASRFVTGPSHGVTDNHEASRDRRASAEQRSTTQLLPQPTHAREDGRSLQERAQAILDNPHNATWDEPKRWGEVIAVAKALTDAQGRAPLRLMSYSQDHGIRRLVELFAAGYSVDELSFAVSTSWFVEGRRALQQLSNTVVDRSKDPPLASDDARPAAIEVTGRDAAWS